MANNCAVEISTLFGELRRRAVQRHVELTQVRADLRAMAVQMRRVESIVQQCFYSTRPSENNYNILGKECKFEEDGEQLQSTTDFITDTPSQCQGEESEQEAQPSGRDLGDKALQTVLLSEVGNDYAAITAATGALRSRLDQLSGLLVDTLLVFNATATVDQNLSFAKSCVIQQCDVDAIDKAPWAASLKDSSTVSQATERTAQTMLKVRTEPDPPQAAEGSESVPQATGKANFFFLGCDISTIDLRVVSVRTFRSHLTGNHFEVGDTILSVNGHVVESPLELLRSVCRLPDQIEFANIGVLRQSQEPSGMVFLQVALRPLTANAKASCEAERGVVVSDEVELFPLDDDEAVPHGRLTWPRQLLVEMGLETTLASSTHARLFIPPRRTVVSQSNEKKYAEK